MRVFKRFSVHSLTSIQLGIIASLPINVIDQHRSFQAELPTGKLRSFQQRFRSEFLLRTNYRRKMSIRVVGNI